MVGRSVCLCVSVYSASFLFLNSLLFFASFPTSSITADTQELREERKVLQSYLDSANEEIQVLIYLICKFR